jgi:hypothetical protein
MNKTGALQMKMTEEQKAKAKIYRDSVSEAQKERLRYSKRLYGERKREENKVKHGIGVDDE